MRHPLPGTQQVLTAKNVQRQIAIVSVATVKETPLLLPVEGRIGGVDIEHDLLGRLGVRFHKHVHQQAVDRFAVTADLLVAVHAVGRAFQPVQRRLAGQRLAAITLLLALLPFQVALAGRQRQHRIGAQLVVIVEILIAQRQRVDPLGLSGSRQGTIAARVDLTAGGSIRTAFVVTQSAAEGEPHEITGVLDAAAFEALISPGSIVSVFGNFAEETNVAGSIPLPSDLSGFSVTFDGKPGALFGVFAGGAFDQANVQVPWHVDVSDGKVEVRVHWKDATSEVWSEPFEVDGGQASPGIYMFPPGTTQAIVTNFKLPDDDVIAGSWAQAPGSVDPVVGQPAAIGGVIIIWSNGLGPVIPEPPTGELPPGNVPVTTKTVGVTIGGQPARVLGPVLQPTNVGLNQINAFVPPGVTPGEKVPIVIEVDCGNGQILRSRADVTIAVRAAP